MARRRRRRRSLRQGYYKVGRKHRTRRLRVHRVKGRAHHLRRGFYRANPRRRRRRYRRNPMFGGKRGIMGMLPNMTDVVFAGVGAAAAPMLLSKLKIADKLPPVIKDGKPNIVGIAVQAGIGAILFTFLGRLAKKPAWGKAMAFGAFAMPVAGYLSTIKPFAGVGADYDFGDLGATEEEELTALEGGLYAAPIEGGLYGESIGADDDMDFGDM